jgi:hypothetical protein
LAIFLDLLSIVSIKKAFYFCLFFKIYLTFLDQTEQSFRNRFKDRGDFSLEDQPRAGRPAELENQRLIELLQEDNRQTTRELAEQLGIDHSTVEILMILDTNINLAPEYHMTLLKTINEAVVNLQRSSQPIQQLIILPTPNYRGREVYLLHKHEIGR